ncbi:MAG: sigma-54-dependent Fis family transcriptional regulator [Desulfovibrionaceae bacterium]|nr:sigma-54-dependent Fis family transcriptional regulator [Desulfovibrionaceae bacterium]
MNDPRRSVLVVDDEPGHRLMVRAVLEHAGWLVLEAASGAEALHIVAAQGPDAPQAALADMRMPGMDGLALLRELRSRRPDMPVILFTAFGSVGSAVEAMKKGAFDYLTKPADNEELKAVLDKAFEYRRLVVENARLREAVGRPLADTLIGSGPAMDRVRALVAQAGPSEATVLISGESGTGKELVARALHRASPRSAGPLVTVNCAALPAELLESELFGYKKGAFTGAARDKPGRFQLAHGGTLFLDEIGELPRPVQAKLLRALQERRVEPLGGLGPEETDARIIAATNRDLRRDVEAKRFREDLFFRLAVLEIDIPPLRERLEDLPLLVGHLLGKLGEKNAKRVRSVSPAFMEALGAHDWPGNVRELENVLERALILARSDRLGPELLPPQISGRAKGSGTAAPDSLDQAEKQALVRALEANQGHRQNTADDLGVSRRSLQYKLKKYGLTKR